MENPIFFSAEKDLLLRFAANRTTGTRDEQCDDDYVGTRKLLWTLGGEGIAQWHAMRPMCAFQGIACGVQGHVIGM